MIIVMLVCGICKYFNGKFSGLLNRSQFSSFVDLAMEWCDGGAACPECEGASLDLCLQGNMQRCVGPGPANQSPALGDSGQ